MATNTVASFDIGIQNMAWIVAQISDPCTSDTDTSCVESDSKTTPRSIMVRCNSLVSLGTKKTPTRQLVSNLIPYLKSLISKFIIDSVVVELQVRGNPKCSMLSYFILGFFQAHDIPTCQIPARSKFSRLMEWNQSPSSPSVDIPHDLMTEIRSYYSSGIGNHKKLSTALATALGRQNHCDEFIDFLDNIKKKDDISDAFLMAYTHIITPPKASSALPLPAADSPLPSEVSCPLPTPPHT
jgi:hypothetical protein